METKLKQEPVADGSVQVVSVTWQDAVAGLERIFGELQTEFHDQWDWVDAYFYVEVLKAQIQSEPVADGGGLPPRPTPPNPVSVGRRNTSVAWPVMRTIKYVEAANAYMDALLTAYASSQESLRAAREENERLKAEVLFQNQERHREHNKLRERMKQAAALLEKDSTYFRSHREAILLLSPEGSSQRHCDYNNCSLPHGHIQSCNELDSKPEGSSR